MVIFDFQGALPNDPQDEMRSTLWCLLPGRARRRAVVIAISRQAFVMTVTKQARLLLKPVHEYINAYDKRLTQQGELREQQAQIQKWQPSKPLRAIIPKQHNKY